MKISSFKKIAITLSIALGLAIGYFILQTYNTPIVQEQQELPVIYDTYNYTENVRPMQIPANMNQDWEEFVTAANLLDAYNIELVQWDWFIEYFPFEENWDRAMSPQGLCWEWGISKGLNNYLVTHRQPFVPRTKALTFEEVETKINQGVPVMVWITEDYKVPQWNYDIKPYDINMMFGYYENNNTVLIKDIDDDIVTFSDANNGIQEMDIKEFAALYEEVGQHALWLERINS